MNKIKENAQEILNLYNYFNGAIIFDCNAVAVYYYNNRPDINDMTEEELNMLFTAIANRIIAVYGEQIQIPIQ